MSANARWWHADGPVHYVEYSAAEPDGHRPPWVLVHGLGGSHVIWHETAALLARTSTAYALDLPGFGYSPLAGRSAGVAANQRLLRTFVTEVVGRPAVIAGNSMGALIALLAAARDPATVAGLALVNAGLARPPKAPLPREVSALFATWLVAGVGDTALRRRWRALGPEGLVAETLRLCCTRPERVSAATRTALATVADHVHSAPAARAAYLEAVRSLLPLLGSVTRFGRLVDAVTAPTVVIHGADDRLVPLAAAEAVTVRRPDWPLVTLAGVGHVPMLEDPSAVADAILAWTAALSGSRADG